MTPPRRRTVRALLVVYLGLGAVLAAGCGQIAMGHRWVGQRLLALEEVQPLEVAAITRLATALDARERLQLELTLLDAGGAAHEFALVSTWGIPPHQPWTEVRVRLGASRLEVGEEFLVLDPAGAVVGSRPLTAEERASALLVFAREEEDRRWYVFASAPPRGGRPPDMALEQLPLVRCALPQPLTEASKRKRLAAGVVLYPLAFVVDVVTWPVQAVAFFVAMSSIGGH